MKTLLTILVTVLFITGCGNNSDSKENSTTTVDTPAKTEVKDPEVAKGLELISKSDCFTCHKLNEASIGPPYNAVAAKYKTINDASMDSMVTQIIKGGKGKWGTIPMAPHPQISTEDAQTMVHYIMSIK
jgi:cytochrome c